MSTNHTPGPWRLEMVPTASGTCHKVGPFPSLGVRQETFACVYADNVRAGNYGHSKVGDELLANARLIAAAPELLEALQLVRMSAGWQHLSGESKAVIDSAIRRALGQ